MYSHLEGELGDAGRVPIGIGKSMVIAPDFIPYTQIRGKNRSRRWGGGLIALPQTPELVGMGLSAPSPRTPPRLGP